MKFLPLEEHHFRWIQRRTGIIHVSDVKGIAVELAGEIIAVCACDSWTATSCQVHIAVDNPICLKHNRLQNEVFDYIFNQAGRQVAIGLVPANNTKALRFDKKVGFTESCRIKDGYELGVDLVIMTLHKSEWNNGR